jgi:hypothetical protein
LVDFAKWGTPGCRELLKKRNDFMFAIKRKNKKVSFCEVNEIFPVSPIFYDEDGPSAPRTKYQAYEIGPKVPASLQYVQSKGHEKAIDAFCPKQAFGLRKKPALYVLDRKQDVSVFGI